MDAWNEPLEMSWNEALCEMSVRYVDFGSNFLYKKIMEVGNE
jgi:hypothetical protein